MKLATAPSASDPLVDLRRAVDHRLGQLLPSPLLADDAVCRAMRAGVLSPGKRVRPVLLLVTARCFGLDDDTLLDAACALEMVHAASLFLDDLPCMDDAAERRGRPALHIEFGEDVALLASVALLSQAFRTVAASAQLTPSVRAQVVTTLADSIGPAGLVHGQYRDLREAQDDVDEAALARTNDLKTGSLFQAALVIPALAARAEPHVIDTLRTCATEFGQAFQLKDDLEDSAHPDAPEASGEDAGKRTLVALLGPHTARQRFQAHVRRLETGLGEVFAKDQSLMTLLRRFAQPADPADPIDPAADGDSQGATRSDSREHGFGASAQPATSRTAAATDDMRSFTAASR